MQDEIQREYGRIAAVTVDEPYVNGAFRAGIGADFPFLSDEDRGRRPELDLLELTDEWHCRTCRSRSCSTRRSASRASGAASGPGATRRPTSCGSACARSRAASSRASTRSGLAGRRLGADRAGIDGDVIWIRENSQGHELWRGAYDGADPRVGDELGHSSVDGRPWIVRRIEREDGRTAIHVSKEGKTGSPRLVGHHMTTPPSVR